MVLLRHLAVLALLALVWSASAFESKELQLILQSDVSVPIGVSYTIHNFTTSTPGLPTTGTFLYNAVYPNGTVFQDGYASNNDGYATSGGILHNYVNVAADTVATWTYNLPNFGFPVLVTFSHPGFSDAEVPFGWWAPSVSSAAGSTFQVFHFSSGNPTLEDVMEHPSGATVANGAITCQEDAGAEQYWLATYGVYISTCTLGSGLPLAGVYKGILRESNGTAYGDHPLFRAKPSLVPSASVVDIDSVTGWTVSGSGLTDSSSTNRVTIQITGPGSYSSTFTQANSTSINTTVQTIASRTLVAGEEPIVAGGYSVVATRAAFPFQTVTLTSATVDISFLRPRIILGSTDIYVDSSFSIPFTVYGLGTQDNFTIDFPNDPTADCTPTLPATYDSITRLTTFNCLGTAAQSPTNIGYLQAAVTLNGQTSLPEQVAVVRGTVVASVAPISMKPGSQFALQTSHLNPANYSVVLTDPNGAFVPHVFSVNETTIVFELPFAGEPDRPTRAGPVEAKLTVNNVDVTLSPVQIGVLSPAIVPDYTIVPAEVPPFTGPTITLQGWGFDHPSGIFTNSTYFACNLGTVQALPATGPYDPDHSVECQFTAPCAFNGIVTAQVAISGVAESDYTDVAAVKPVVYTAPTWYQSAPSTQLTIAGMGFLSIGSDIVFTVTDQAGAVVDLTLDTLTQMEAKLTITTVAPPTVSGPFTVYGNGSGLPSDTVVCGNFAPVITTSALEFSASEENVISFSGYALYDPITAVQYEFFDSELAPFDCTVTFANSTYATCELDGDMPTFPGPVQMSSSTHPGGNFASAFVVLPYIFPYVYATNPNTMNAPIGSTVQLVGYALGNEQSGGLPIGYTLSLATDIPSPTTLTLVGQTFDASGTRMSTLAFAVDVECIQVGGLINGTVNFDGLYTSELAGLFVVLPEIQGDLLSTFSAETGSLITIKGYGLAGPLTLTFSATPSCEVVSITLDATNHWQVLTCTHGAVVTPGSFTVGAQTYDGLPALPATPTVGSFVPEIHVDGPVISAAPGAVFEFYGWGLAATSFALQNDLTEAIPANFVVTPTGSADNYTQVVTVTVADGLVRWGDLTVTATSTVDALTYGPRIVALVRPFLINNTQVVDADGEVVRIYGWGLFPVISWTFFEPNMGIYTSFVTLGSLTVGATNNPSYMDATYDPVALAGEYCVQVTAVGGSNPSSDVHLAITFRPVFSSGMQTWPALPGSALWVLTGSGFCDTATPTVVLAPGGSCIPDAPTAIGTYPCSVTCTLDTAPDHDTVVTATLTYNSIASASTNIGRLQPYVNASVDYVVDAYPGNEITLGGYALSQMLDPIVFTSAGSHLGYTFDCAINASTATANSVSCNIVNPPRVAGVFSVLANGQNVVPGVTLPNVLSIAPYIVEARPAVSALPQPTAGSFTGYALFDFAFDTNATSTCLGITATQSNVDANNLYTFDYSLDTAPCYAGDAYVQATSEGLTSAWTVFAEIHPYLNTFPTPVGFTAGTSIAFTGFALAGAVGDYVTDFEDDNNEAWGCEIAPVDENSILCIFNTTETAPKYHGWSEGLITIRSLDSNNLAQLVDFVPTALIKAELPILPAGLATGYTLYGTALHSTTGCAYTVTDVVSGGSGALTCTYSADTFDWATNNAIVPNATSSVSCSVAEPHLCPGKMTLTLDCGSGYTVNVPVAVVKPVVLSNVAAGDYSAAPSTTVDIFGYALGDCNANNVNILSSTDYFGVPFTCDVQAGASITSGVVTRQCQINAASPPATAGPANLIWTADVGDVFGNGTSVVLNSDEQNVFVKFMPKVTLAHDLTAPLNATTFTVHGFGLGNGTLTPQILALTDSSGDVIPFTTSNFAQSGQSFDVTFSAPIVHAGPASLDYQINSVTAQMDIPVADIYPFVASPVTPPLFESAPGTQVTLTGFALAQGLSTVPVITAVDHYDNAWICDWASSTADGQSAQCIIPTAGSPKEPGVAKFTVTSEGITSVAQGLNVHMLPTIVPNTGASLQPNPGTSFDITGWTFGIQQQVTIYLTEDAACAANNPQTASNSGPYFGNSDYSVTCTISKSPSRATWLQTQISTANVSSLSNLQVIGLVYPFITQNTTQVVPAGPTGQLITVTGYALNGATFTTFQDPSAAGFYSCGTLDYADDGTNFTCITEGSAFYSGYITADVQGLNSNDDTASATVIAWARPALQVGTNSFTVQPNIDFIFSGWGIENVITPVALSTGGSCDLTTASAVLDAGFSHPNRIWNRECRIVTSPFDAGDFTATIASSTAPFYASPATQVGVARPFIIEAASSYTFAANPDTLVEVFGYSFGPASNPPVVAFQDYNGDSWTCGNQTLVGAGHISCHIDSVFTPISSAETEAIVQAGPSTSRRSSDSTVVGYVTPYLTANTVQRVLGIPGTVFSVSGYGLSSTCDLNYVSVEDQHGATVSLTLPTNCNAQGTYFEASLGNSLSISAGPFYAQVQATGLPGVFFSNPGVQLGLFAPVVSVNAAQPIASLPPNLITISGWAFDPRPDPTHTIFSVDFDDPIAECTPAFPYTDNINPLIGGPYAFTCDITTALSFGGNISVSVTVNGQASDFAVIAQVVPKITPNSDGFFSAPGSSLVITGSGLGKNTTTPLFELRDNYGTAFTCEASTPLLDGTYVECFVADVSTPPGPPLFPGAVHGRIIVDGQPSAEEFIGIAKPSIVADSVTVIDISPAPSAITILGYGFSNATPSANPILSLGAECAPGSVPTFNAATRVWSYVCTLSTPPQSAGVLTAILQFEGHSTDETVIGNIVPVVIPGTPPTLPGSVGQVLHIVGGGFAGDAVLTLNDGECHVNSVYNYGTEIDCVITVPPVFSGLLSAVLTTGSQSIAVDVANIHPVLASGTLSSEVFDAGLELTIVGTGFGNVTLAGSALELTLGAACAPFTPSANGQSAVCTFSPRPTTTGTLTARLTANGYPSAYATVGNVRPQIFASPSQIVSAAPGSEILLNGVGIDGSTLTLTLSDGACTVTVINSTTVKCVISTAPVFPGIVTGTYSVDGATATTVQVATIVPAVTLSNQHGVINSISQIVFTGYGFGTVAPSVSFNNLGASCTANAPLFQGTQFTCVLGAQPQDSGYLEAVVTALASDSSTHASPAAQVLVVDPMVTASLTPASAAAASVITIAGAGFGTSQPTVTFGQAGISCTAIAPFTTNQIQCELSADGVPKSGAVSAYVTAANGLSSAEMNVALIYPTVATSNARVSFNNVQPGALLTINGFGFKSTPSVVLNRGASCVVQTVAADGKSLDCLVDSAPLSAGALTASIVASGQLSGAGVSIASVYPVVSAPTNFTAAPSVVITVEGAGFGTAAPTVTFDDSAVQCTAAAPSGGVRFACTLTSLPTKAGALTGTVRVQGIDSDNAQLVVLAPGLVASSVQHSALPGTVFTISGYALGSTEAITVTLGTSACTTPVTNAQGTAFDCTLDTTNFPKVSGELTAQVTVASLQSASVVVAVLKPYISLNTAQELVASGPNTIRLNGYALSPLDKVTLNLGIGVACTIGSSFAADGTWVDCDLAGAIDFSGVLEAFVTLNGVSSNTDVIGYFVPSVSAAASPFSAADGTQITIYGAGFTSSVTIVLKDDENFNVGCTSISFNAHQITCTFPVGSEPRIAGPLNATVTSTVSGVPYTSAPEVVGTVIPVVSSGVLSIVPTALEITIHGFGFGTTTAPTVDLGPDAGCVASVPTSSQAFVCTLFDRPDTAGSLTAKVTVNGVESNTAVITEVVASLIANATYTASAAPGTTLEIRGYGFGSSPAVSLNNGAVCAPGTPVWGSSTVETIPCVLTTPPTVAGPLTATVTVAGVPAFAPAVVATIVPFVLASSTRIPIHPALTSVTVTGYGLGTSSAPLVGLAAFGAACSASVPTGAGQSFTCTFSAQPSQATELNAVIAVAGVPSASVSLGRVVPVVLNTVSTPLVPSIGSSLLITGYGFGSSAGSIVVALSGGGACAVNSAPSALAGQPESLVCTVTIAPSGTGSLSAAVSVSGIQSDSVEIGTIALPVFSSTQSLPAVTGGIITVTGQGFTATPTVTLTDGAACTPSTPTSVLQFTCTVTAVPVTAGAVNITACVSGVCSASVPIAVFTPVVTASATVYSAGAFTTLTITGAGFGAVPPVVSLTNGASCVATIVTPGTTVSCAISNLQSAGRLYATVTVGSVAPSPSVQVAALSPVVEAHPEVILSNVASSVMVHGAYFASTGLTVVLSPTGTCAPVSITSTTLTCLIDPSVALTVGLLNAVVSVDGISSAAVQIATTQLVPAVYPDTVTIAAGALVDITIAGGNFAPGATTFLTLSSGACLVQPVTSTTELVCTLTVAPAVGPLRITAISINSVPTYFIPAVAVATVFQQPELHPVVSSANGVSNVPAYINIPGAYLPAGGVAIELTSGSCAILFFNSTLVTCQLNSVPPFQAGIVQARVNVNGGTYYSAWVPVLHIHPRIDTAATLISVSNSAVNLTITGESFGTDVEDATVTLSNSVCQTIYDYTDTSFVCELHVFTVGITHAQLDRKISDAITFTHAADVARITPWVTAMEDRKINAGTTAITLTGVGFTASNSVAFVSRNETVASTSASATLLVVPLPAEFAPGPINVVVSVTANGEAIPSNLATVGTLVPVIGAVSFNEKSKQVSVSGIGLSGGSGVEVVVNIEPVNNATRKREPVECVPVTSTYTLFVCQVNNLPLGEYTISVSVGGVVTTPTIVSIGSPAPVTPVDSAVEVLSQGSIAAIVLGVLFFLVLVGIVVLVIIWRIRTVKSPKSKNGSSGNTVELQPVKRVEVARPVVELAPPRPQPALTASAQSPPPRGQRPARRDSDDDVQDHLNDSSLTPVRNDAEVSHSPPRSVSHSGSSSGSHSGSGSRTPSHSGSQSRSPSTSRSSRSRSPSRSRSSRSGSGSGSRSRSPSASHSGSQSGSQSVSRSKSGSASRSRSPSPSHSISGSDH